MLPSLVSAQLIWQIPSGSPPASAVKYDDIYMIGNRGMVCRGGGNIFLTTDSWSSNTLVYSNPTTFCRSLLMADTMNAWFGNFGYYPGSGISDTNELYHTADGGFTWSPVQINTSIEYGICGLNKGDNQHFFGVGRVEGPAAFIKSADAGQTWSFTDMSPYCGFLVDCHFFNGDTGFVAGGSTTNTSICIPIILKTTDGGVSWDTVYLNGLQGSYIWKLYALNDSVLFASIESVTLPVTCLRSIDGGNTWTSHIISTNDVFNLQAIGFVNDSIGWAGGYYGDHLYETNDGGSTWTFASVQAQNVNRIRKVNDTLLWAAGKYVYKITTTPVAPVYTHHGNPLKWNVLKGSRSKWITLQIEDFNPSKNYFVTVYDVTGRLIREILLPHPSNEINLSQIENTLIYIVFSDGENYSTRSHFNY